MGLFFVGCKVLNPAKLERAAAVSRLMVRVPKHSTARRGRIKTNSRRPIRIKVK
jgi:hypothetical protein